MNNYSPDLQSRVCRARERAIYENFKRLLEDRGAYEEMARASNPYGDGFACRRIADILERE